MTRQEIFKRLNRIFQDFFDDDNIVLSETTTAQDIKEWDSLAHVNLMVIAQKEFGFQFELGEATEIESIGELVDIVLERAKI
jgi:acyl carrier protein